MQKIHRKNRKLQIKVSEFDCLTGYSVLFLLFETNFVFVICSYVIWYVIGVNLYSD